VPALADLAEPRTVEDVHPVADESDAILPRISRSLVTTNLARSTETIYIE
jgi:hypothetical protein